MKKQITLAIIMMGIGIGLAADKQAPEIVIADKGKSDYVIVVPDGEDVGNRVKMASDLLQATLVTATGVKLPVVKESELKAGTPAIYLGRTQAAEKAGILVKELKGWAFLKQVQGKDVFLVGIDASAGIDNPGHRGFFGTLKAVTSFLEDEVGVRFVLPSPNGRFIPKLDRLAVKPDLRVFNAPVFTYILARDAGDFNYMVANNYFDGSKMLSYSGHSHNIAVPAEKYGKEHPEYFALLGGVRTTAGNHLCVSNPEVQDLMIQELERQFDKGYDWVELGQTDGFRACECDKCMAMHKDAGERLWILHKKLAERIKKERPGKKVMILVYGPTINPPKSFDKLPNNVVLELCHYSPEDFDAWKKYGAELTVYIYNWGIYQTMGVAGPKRTTRYAGEQVRLFAENRVQGIYGCGGQELQGLEGPVYYVYGKMLGNPKLNYEDLANDFYRAAYGKAKAPMKAFFTAMYDRLEAWSVFNRPNFRSDNTVGAFGTPEDCYCYFFPSKLLDDMGKNLERAKALAAADEPTVQARVRLVEFEFNYVKTLATIFQLYRAYRLKPTWTNFDQLAEEIERRNAMLDSFYDEKGNFKNFDGWPKFFGNVNKATLKNGGVMAGVLTAPMGWNTKLLKEKRVLPGVGTKTAKVARVKGIAFTGKMDDPAWQAIAPEEMNEITMGQLENSTVFKLAYDDQNLYIGLECTYTKPDKVAIPPFGHDGKCWSADCVEIILDPSGNRDRYYHFIFNAVANSYYDSRRGFFDDPIHPLYAAEDVSWNGKWEYLTAIDKEKKRWTAEVKIPFASLGAEAPKSGTTWAGNFGRENDGWDIGLWSPNLEERDICAFSSFGSLVFE